MPISQSKLFNCRERGKHQVTLVFTSFYLDKKYTHGADNFVKIITYIHISKIYNGIIRKRRSDFYDNPAYREFRRIAR